VAGNVEQAAYWADRAESWIAAEENLRRISDLFTDAAFEALAVRPGERVLDIGCGTGRTTLELARQASEGGAARGVDIAEEMLVRARELADELGVGNASFTPADAQVDDLGAATYEAAFSRFGIMFFTDPVAAFANIRKALVAGGRLTFLCWASVFENEWMLVPGMAVVSVTGELPPLPGEGEPGPFSLDNEDRIRSVLEAAGFENVAVDGQPRQIVIAESEIEQFVTMATQVGAIREALEKVTDAEARGRIESALRDALEQRLDNGSASLSAAAWLVTATSV
jgi:SAM-dependent methyltransferase